MARTTLTLAAGEGCTYEWKGHGLRLHVPADALEPHTSPTTMTIWASLSGHYHLPDHTRLVSGVYWISFPRKLNRPITLELQHCASLQQSHQLPYLSFVTAKCNQATLPYDFKPLEGGVFSANSQYGVIGLSHFSGFAIVLKRWLGGGKDAVEIKYAALTYYIPQLSPTTWQVHLPIILDLDLYIKVQLRCYLHNVID